MKKNSGKIRILIFVSLLGVLTIIAGWLFLSELMPSEGPVWRGIIIGLSTKEDVVRALGQPSSIKKGIITTTFVYHEEGIVKETQYVVIRYGIVQEVEENTLVYSDYIKLKSLVEKYGSPRMVEWSLEGPDRRTVVFNNEVMANVVVSHFDDAVITKIIYHRPMPLILLRLKYMRIFLSVDPFPNSDIVGAKDPWFNTSNSCRDSCE